MDFMERNGLQEGALPAFWYDQSRDVSLISLHSLYYYGYTLVSDEMPIPDAELRARLDALGAKHVVLLCADPACGGGGAALRHARVRPGARRGPAARRRLEVRLGRGLPARRVGVRRASTSAVLGEVAAMTTRRPRS